MMKQATQDSFDLRNYINLDYSMQQSKLQVNQSDTLLLQTTDFPKIKQSIKNQSKHVKTSHILNDLLEQLEVNMSKSNIKSQSQKQKLQKLQGILSNFADTLSLIKSKVEKIQEQKKDGIAKDLQNNIERDLHSFITYSSLANSKGSKGSRGCTCEHNNIESQLKSNIKLQLYSEQNQKLKDQVVSLRVQAEEMKKAVKKLQVQNIKMKELIRQYQNFNKRQNILEYQEQQQNKNNMMLSQRRLVQNKSALALAQTNKKTQKQSEYFYKERQIQDKQNQKTKQEQVQNTEKKILVPKYYNQNDYVLSTNINRRQSTRDILESSIQREINNQKVPLSHCLINSQNKMGLNKTKITTFSQCKNIDYSTQKNNTKNTNQNCNILLKQKVQPNNRNRNCEQAATSFRDLRRQQRIINQTIYQSPERTLNQTKNYKQKIIRHNI